jgi:hypothetical protein
MRTPEPGGSRVRRALAVALLAGATLLLAGSTRHHKRSHHSAPAEPVARVSFRHATPDSFPAGAGGEIAGRACVMCHSPSLVTQQRKDSLGWEKTLVLMEKWGAPVPPAEHDSLRGWLLANFGATKR